MSNENEILKYNALTKTRFIMNLDLIPVLGRRKSLENFTLNCFSISTPEIAAGVTYTSYDGYQIPEPNGNRDEEKILRIGFTVSENLIQYAAMLCWINKVTSQFEETNAYGDEIRTTANLFTLDSYLKPTKVPIHYDGIFIGRLGALEFDQQDQSGDIMTCTADFYFFKSHLDYDAILAD